ncbi:MAG: hypothetical protein ACK56F_30700, partial [bacterium]
MPRSCGFNAIMVVTDVLTKYVVVSALRDKTAAEVGQAFWNDYVCHYLFPKMVQTDRGKEFTSDLAQAFFRAAVDKVQSTAYHPQSQREVERFNRTMTVMLAKHVGAKQEEWYEYLKQVQVEYNSHPHAVTGYSPYYL